MGESDERMGLLEAGVLVRYLEKQPFLFALVRRQNFITL
jgi:hypothetical protein